MKEEILIVVLNYMNYSLTIQCINKIIEYKNTKIIVVDNDSQNESYIILKEKYKKADNVAVLRNETNTGYAKGNNFGVQKGMELFPECSYLIIMNPDIVVEDKVIRAMLQILRENKEISLIAPTLIENGKITEDSTGWNLWDKKEVLKSISYLWGRTVVKDTNGYVKNYKDCTLKIIDVVKGCFFMTRMSDFIEVGMLDERTFLYGEEDILGFKLSKRGKKTVCILNEYCIHCHDRSVTTTLKGNQLHLQRTFFSRFLYYKEYLHANILECFVYKILSYAHIRIEYPLVYFIKYFGRH